MSGENRLADIVSALKRLKIPYLIMGGHAARYYGVERNTVDYDIHISLDNDWNRLSDILQTDPFTARAGMSEGPSWRPEDFRRFMIGRLPDGREEWLEFWRRNHLLSPFRDMYERREEGSYGGRAMEFLSLPDLIRSKETERESDWRDIEMLEEISDARNFSRSQDDAGVLHMLSYLRSRRGFEAAHDTGFLARPGLVARAQSQAANPITRAYLFPYLPVNASQVAGETGMLAEIFAGPLHNVQPGSVRHLALVEAVRRLYKQAAIAADRDDKVRAGSHRNRG